MKLVSKDFLDALTPKFCLCCGFPTDLYLCNKCRAAIIHYRQTLEHIGELNHILEGVEEYAYSEGGRSSSTPTDTD